MNDTSILPRRMRLETPEVRATVPMLRGVWGAALHDLDIGIYRAVFAPPNNSEHSHVPGYVLRPAPPDPHFAPAVDWILIGDALQHDETLRRAWDIASGMGLDRERCPFDICEVRVLGPNGLATEAVKPWSLSQVTWPLAGPKVTPCRLFFPAPLRLLRRGQLITQPTLADLVVTACRRIGNFLPVSQRTAWDNLSRDALELARTMRDGEWSGSRLDLHRYSGRQKAELDLRGVSGAIDLPEGPGELWPLLAAAQWLHIGKGTVMGLGQMRIEPSPQY
ncbi:MAG: CRISPR system precrRNA processing endoribonuclease RAMP protein Cas6 [Planctomycetales bacterium]|nr:CRISPR system precrRNA processing endoribonuclease RAMP protein Cas6 [Planctomycetales bacterium]